MNIAQANDAKRELMNGEWSKLIKKAVLVLGDKGFRLEVTWLFYPPTLPTAILGIPIVNELANIPRLP